MSNSQKPSKKARISKSGRLLQIKSNSRRRAILFSDVSCCMEAKKEI